MIRQRLVIAALSSFAGKFASVAIWFLLTPFVLAHVGPEGYALWVLMGAVTSYGSLMDFGVGAAVMKYVAEHVARGEREQARTMVASALWISLGLAIITVAAGILVSKTLPVLFKLPAARQSYAEWLLLLTSIDVAVTIAFSPRVALLRGLQRYDLDNGVNLFVTLLQAAAVVAVLLAGFGVLGMAAVNIPINVVRRLACTLLTRRIAPDLLPGLRDARLPTMRRIAAYSCTNFTIDVASRLQSKSDEFVIALFRPLNAVTPYALARKLGEAATMATSQCLKMLLPLASELDATDRARKLQKLYIVASRLALAIAVPIAVLLGLAGGAVLSVWVGPEYARYAPLVTVLSLATLISTSQWPASEMLQGIAKHRIVARTALLSGLCNIALSALLLRPLGLLGVALGTLIPVTVASLGVIMPFAIRTLRISPATALRDIWLPGLVPGAAAAVVLSILQRLSPAPNFAVVVSWGMATAIVYGLGYLLMPAATAERQLLSDAMATGSRSFRRLVLDPLGVR